MRFGALRDPGGRSIELGIEDGALTVRLLNLLRN